METQLVDSSCSVRRKQALTFEHLFVIIVTPQQSFVPGQNIDTCRKSKIESYKIAGRGKNIGRICW